MQAHDWAPAIVDVVFAVLISVSAFDLMAGSFPARFFTHLSVSLENMYRSLADSVSVSRTKVKVTGSVGAHGYKD
ncbi:hypothetical protein BJ878DRAFT_246482 [Calycina marina]|uniref:Uncharacterized protein n=1 Tax=Calycina marina TaxID=1763456 RepID=A0A9P7YWW2_9HELO|nr:hypothetical protein BJ878DRAFT_246482 [Calycina marina]